jgi:hypothetical protein
MALRKCLLLSLVWLLTTAGNAAADLTSSLKKGTPDLKSISSMSFGPDGVLFVGDPQGAAVFAIGTADTKPTGGNGGLKVDGIDEKIAAMLGTTPKEMRLADLAVNPASGNAYVGVMRGTGSEALPVIMRIDRGGKIGQFELKDVPFAKVELPNPAAGDRARMQSITKVSFINGNVVVAGLSNEEWASTLHSIPFPFKTTEKGAGIQIYHGAHGKFETNAPVRTFTAYDINGQAHLLAAYTCTPLVKIPVTELKPGAKVKGTTVAELGNRNSPLDMIVYQKDGKDYVLIANSSRGMMKVTTDNIDKMAGITDPVRGGTGTAGLPYEKIEKLQGVVQMDRLDKDNAVVLIQTPAGVNLQTVALP